jgi:hypothetical protein
MPIKIDGLTRRSFIFPAGIGSAFAYFSDLDRIFTWLPHISVLRKYSETSYRLLYSTIELGVYSIRIVCDIQATLDKDVSLLLLVPIKRPDQVESSFGLRSIQAQGSYSSESRFTSLGNKTRIDYSLRIQASLPTPLATVYMPPSIRNSIASRITTWRIREIAEGFIETSIDKFHQA